MSDPVEETQIEAQTHAGLLRQLANEIDEHPEIPVAVAVVVAYPSDTHIAYGADDLGALVDAADFLNERLLELAVARAN